MRVLYIAKHGSGGNDDEGAIAYALEVLGHKVTRVDEGLTGTSYDLLMRMSDCDLLLFHKWSVPSAIGLLKGIDCPKAFWYFDLVQSQDSTLVRRDTSRILWMSEMIPLVDYGFCTDGDWVDKDTTGKLVLLRQGADERVVGRGLRGSKPYPILFTGTIRGVGTRRTEWMDHMQKVWGEDFHHFPHGLYRESLRNKIASSTFVVCPDFPVTNRYWSNRVYNAAGFGGCVIHAKALDLMSEYAPDREIRYYSCLDELDYHIAYLANDRRVRNEMAEMALERTKRDHLYRHRVEAILKIVKENRRGGSNTGSTVLETSPQVSTG